MKVYLSKKTLLLTILAAIGLAVAYYFWEVFLYAYYLGGYDQHGLLIQSSKPGFNFFFQAWPLWLFPLILAVCLAWFFSALKRREDQNKISTLLDEIDQKNKEMDALQYELELADKKIQENKQEYKSFEEEFAVLMDEYQQSQHFIEKLLEKLKAYDA